MNDYKKTTTFNTRLNLSRSIIDKNYKKVPIIIESKKAPYFLKKIIVSRDMCYGEFIRNIIFKILTNENNTIIFFVNSKGKDILVTPNKMIGEIYDLHKNDDDFLYLSWIEENTFGN